MIIADLNYLEDFSEEFKITGGKAKNNANENAGEIDNNEKKVKKTVINYNIDYNTYIISNSYATSISNGGDAIAIANATSTSLKR